MTAAARRLHTSTSAISQQMTLLEREVSLPLLERVGRRVRLNEAGKALVAYYREISAAVEAAETSLTLFHTDVHGTVAISTLPSFCSTILPHALIALRRAYPSLETIVRDMEPVESVARLRSGDIDVAVVDDLHDVLFDGVVNSSSPGMTAAVRQAVTPFAMDARTHAPYPEVRCPKEGTDRSHHPGNAFHRLFPLPGRRPAKVLP